MTQTALIADIRRLTIHDGPGTRDTVFVKGCPLHCLWCHNPECISPSPQILYRDNLCIGCKDCAAVCQAKAHVFQNGKHFFERNACISCGKCAETCLNGALSLCGGKRQSPEYVFKEVIKDKDFFTLSEGGVTVSGGEPLLYTEFTADLFRILHSEGVHTALDTCGAVPFSAFQCVLPETDMILYDIKGMDSERHRFNTGMDNSLILDNLSRLGRMDVPIEIRMPIVPGHNDAPEEIAEAGRFFAALPSVVRVRLLAYHSMARDKYRMCGRVDTMPNVEPPSHATLQKLSEIVASESGKPVSIPEE